MKPSNAISICSKLTPSTAPGSVQKWNHSPLLCQCLGPDELRSGTADPEIQMGLASTSRGTKSIPNRHRILITCYILLHSVDFLDPLAVTHAAGCCPNSSGRRLHHANRPLHQPTDSRGRLTSCMATVGERSTARLDIASLRRR